MSDQADVTGPLVGLRVLDFTQALAGPFCTQILADLGAEVVKIEPPGGGDLSRRSGPFHPADTEQRHAGYFHSINRNKKSVTLDLKDSAGADCVRRLVPEFDVVVENFRVGVMDRLGLGYEALAALNPRLVYAAVRGFGDPRTGLSPYADWPAYDVVAQAMGGMLGVTGSADGEPVKIGPGVGDTVPALYLGIGILAAVLHARKTGYGQFVDVAMADAVLGASERIVHQYAFGGLVPGPEGNHHPFLLPFGVYPAADGHVALACPSEHFFRDLCIALDAPELADDPRYRGPRARAANKAELIEILSSVTSRLTKNDLAKRLGGKVPFGPVYRIDEIARDTHFVARGMLPTLEIPGVAERLCVAGQPIHFSATPAQVRRRGPDLGEHTAEVLSAFGLPVPDLDPTAAHPRKP